MRARAVVCAHHVPLLHSRRCSQNRTHVCAETHHETIPSTIPLAAGRRNSGEVHAGALDKEQRERSREHYTAAETQSDTSGSQKHASKQETDGKQCTLHDSTYSQFKSVLNKRTVRGGRPVFA